MVCPVQLMISASKVLAKWMKVELPRLPNSANNQIGRQRLTTSETAMAWQCHVIGPKRFDNIKSNTKGTVIAVEAFSRYCLIMPGLAPMTPAELEEQLKRRWSNDIAQLAINNKSLDQAAMPTLFQQFYTTPLQVSWVQNSDPSITRHFVDAEKSIRAAYGTLGVEGVDEAQAMILGEQINQKIKLLQEQPRFCAATRMLEDGLFRFAKGLSPGNEQGAVLGDFRNPYQAVEVNTP